MIDVQELARQIAEPLRQELRQATRLNEMALQAIYRELTEQPLESSATKELRKWREQSRKRIKRGARPRMFVSDVIPGELLDRVWSVLARADSLDGIDKAFATVLNVAAPEVAGLAVQALDTGRVLLIQRARLMEDPAAGMWEFPGGHIEPNEDPLDAAFREWQEETGHRIPDGDIAGMWRSPNGIYCGYRYLIPSEDEVILNMDTEDRHVLNPDDPDGDQVEVAAWFDVGHLIGNPALRPEMATTDWDLFGVSELQRYNPNHDEHGRFAEGGGGPRSRLGPADRRAEARNRVNVINPRTGNVMDRTGVGKVGAKMYQEQVAQDLPFKGKVEYLSAGKNENVPLDFVHGDGTKDATGVELKTISIDSANQKTAISRDEADRKWDLADEKGWKTATVLQVLDHRNSTISVYWHPDIVSKTKGAMNHVGTYKVPSSYWPSK